MSLHVLFMCQWDCFETTAAVLLNVWEQTRACSLKVTMLDGWYEIKNKTEYIKSCPYIITFYNINYCYFNTFVTNIWVFFYEFAYLCLQLGFILCFSLLGGCLDAFLPVFCPHREPLSVNLQSKHLARDIERVIQGTSLKVNNKGCCWWDSLDCFLHSW